MSKFTNPIIVELLPGGRKVRVVESFSYDIGKKGGTTIRIPAGFVSDGASIPRIFWFIVGSPLTGKYRAGAILHDFLYYSALYPRKRSDEIFLEAMTVLNVNKVKRTIIFWAVRIGAEWSWNKHRENKFSTSSH